MMSILEEIIAHLIYKPPHKLFYTTNVKIINSVLEGINLQTSTSDFSYRVVIPSATNPNAVEAC